MAAPHPERELQRLRRTLAKSLPRVVVVLGASRFFRGEAFEAARAVLPEDVDVRSLEGGQATDGKELMDLRGGTLFGRGAWLAVRRGDAWLARHGERLLGVLETIAPGCGLLLEVTKLDRRTKLAKALAARGEVFEFRDLYAEPYDRSRSPLEAELIGWLVARAKAMGLTLRPEAALLLVTVTGKEPGALLTELRRLRDQLEDPGTPVTEELLRGRLISSFGSTPFELAEAVLAGDRRRATRSVEAMFQRGAPGRDGATIDRAGVLPFAMSWLHRSLAQVYEARVLLDEGVALEDVPGRLGVRTFVERFLAQVRANPRERLERGLLWLVDLQRRQRTTGEDPAWAVHTFLALWFGSMEAASW